MSGSRPSPLLTLGEVLQGLGDGEGPGDVPSDSLRRLTAGLGRPVACLMTGEGGHTHESLLWYLGSIGVAVSELADLLLVNDVPDEEELHATEVEEGIVLTVASDGAFFLFTK